MAKASWCSVDPASGTGDKTGVKVTGTEYTGRTARNTTLTVKTTTGSPTQTKTISVNQVATEQIQVTFESASVSALTTSVSFSGTSNSPKLTFDISNATLSTLTVNGASYTNGANITGDPGASGKLYETSKGVSYGTIAGSKVEYSKDSGYEVFETSVSITAGGFAILFNSEGNVVGVSKASTDTSSKFIGISDLKAQIETMINEHGIMYCGITGQNVTEELAAKYGLPSGVYISNVDIDSPAYYAGLQAGDVISAINGQSVLTIQQFSEKLYQCADGEAMYVTAMRQGKDGYSDVAFSVSVQLKQLN